MFRPLPSHGPQFAPAWRCSRRAARGQRQRRRPGRGGRRAELRRVHLLDRRAVLRRRLGEPNSGYNVLSGDGDVAGSTGGYTLTLLNRTVGPDADDQIGEARALAVGATTTAESVSNGADVDAFKFTAGANQRLAFDVDRTSGSSLDSYLRIFDAAGRQLAYNDNGYAPGEAPATASYLEFTFPSAGTYFVAVSGSPNRTYSATTGGGDVSGSAGGYTLTVTGRATAAGSAGAAATPTVAEVRARRMATVFSERRVTEGELLIDGEAPAALARVTVLEA